MLRLNFPYYLGKGYLFLLAVRHAAEHDNPLGNLIITENQGIACSQLVGLLHLCLHAASGKIHGRRQASPAQVVQQLEALEKAKTMVHDKINKRCEALLTDCDKYIEKTTLAETNCGARGTRLTLVKNRLKAQQTNFQEHVSENEDADYTDLTIQLKSVQLTYEAALSSISYVLQTSLLDFVR